MSEIEVELDGKKLWPTPEYVDGEVTGIALQTNEALANGDGIPSLKLKVLVKYGDLPGEELTVLTDLKVAFLIQILAAVRGRLEHLQSIKDMIASVKH